MRNKPAVTMWGRLLVSLVVLSILAWSTTASAAPTTVFSETFDAVTAQTNFAVDNNSVDGDWQAKSPTGGAWDRAGWQYDMDATTTNQQQVGKLAAGSCPATSTYELRRTGEGVSGSQFSFRNGITTFNVDSVASVVVSFDYRPDLVSTGSQGLRDFHIAVGNLALTNYYQVDGDLWAYSGNPKPEFTVTVGGSSTASQNTGTPNSIIQSKHYHVSAKFTKTSSTTTNVELTVTSSDGGWTYGPTTQTVSSAVAAGTTFERVVVYMNRRAVCGLENLKVETNPAAVPHISLSPTSLSPSATQGSSPANQTFDVWNGGSGTLSYSISDNQTWLSESPTTGSSTGEHDTITVSYSTASLTPGTYNATITVTAAGADNTPQTIPVTLTINADQSAAGKGFFLTPPGNNWDYVGWSSAILNNPDVTGFQYQYVWSDIETSDGVYDFSRINTGLEFARSHNKKFAFKFFTMNGEPHSDDGTKTYTNICTPSWYFGLPGVQYFGNKTFNYYGAIWTLPKYPVFWDEVYLDKMDDLIAALAAEYDGDPAIEYIRIGGWSCETNEPNGYGDLGQLSCLEDQLDSRGESYNYVGIKPDNLPYDCQTSIASIAIQNMWFTHFTQTQIAGVIHFPKQTGSWCEVFNENLLDHQAIMMNTGLNEGDHTDSRTTFRDWHDNRGCKVGWGGITNLGSKGSEHPMATDRITATWEGIGDDSDQDWDPAMRTSYMVTGKDWVDAPDTGNGEPEATLGWANDHFVE